MTVEIVFCDFVILYYKIYNSKVMHGIILRDKGDIFTPKGLTEKLTTIYIKITWEEPHAILPTTLFLLHHSQYSWNLVNITQQKLLGFQQTFSSLLVIPISCLEYCISFSKCTERETRHFCAQLNTYFFSVIWAHILVFDKRYWCVLHIK